MADGDAPISIGITEPDAGSAVQNMRASLTADGPGALAELNALARTTSTLGRVAQGSPGRLVPLAWGQKGARASARCIDAERPEGISVTGRHKGMGIHAATEAELAFDGVEITEEEIRWPLGPWPTPRPSWCC